MQTVTLKAPVKINLYLGVYQQLDERGYHRVDSVMAALSAADTVEVRELSSPLSGEGPRIVMSTNVGVEPQNNTAWRAAVLLGKAFHRAINSYEITIQKNIPPQSGLGAASSDGASVLLALCHLWGEDPLDPRVVSVAQALGADVAFFLRPQPSYLAGAGDTLVKTFPDLIDMPVVLVRPEGGVSTPEAYAAFDAEPTDAAPKEELFEALEQQNISAIARHISNNLGPVACRLIPACTEVRSWLLEQEGVLGAQVSGSGSAVFGICASQHEAERIAAAATAQGWWSEACTTVGKDFQFC